MTHYAEVALNTPVRQTFDYHIPDDLHGKIQPGHLVRVAFGTAMQPGIVVNLHEFSEVEKTKPIEARLDPKPVLTEEQILLSQWISETYFAPIGFCLWLWLPAGLTGHSDRKLTLLQPDAKPADPLQDQIVTLLMRRKDHAERYRKLKQVVLRDGENSESDHRLEQVVKALLSAGVIASEPILSPPRVKPQSLETVSLAIHPATIPDIVRYLGKRSARADLLEAVADLTRITPQADIRAVLATAGSSRPMLRKLAQEDQLVEIEGDAVRLALPAEEVDELLIHLRKAETDLRVLRVLARESQPVDVSWVYAQTGAKAADLKRLAELEFVLPGEKHTWRDSLAERDFVPASAPVLTAGQRAVWEKIKAYFDPTPNNATPPFFLLHGVTGSGKTEIYLRTIEATLAQGRQAILLVPEIALTAQTIRRVVARFPGKIALIHSKLNPGELYDTWRRCREGLVEVVVGTRSALFAPLPDVGSICIDEEHDDSYKNLAAPHYDTRQVAGEMMLRQNGVLILGSATPDIESFHRAFDPDDPLEVLHLPDRIMGHRIRITEQSEREGLPTKYANESDDAVTIPLPPVAVVDMRDELKAGNTSMFSRVLHEAIEQTLLRHEQIILLLNRRGAATYVFCRDCGYVVQCPRCDTPLTHHQYSATLKCHHCGYEILPPETCPNCKSKRIRFFGAGTQQVEAEIQKLFPRARVVRWDADTARNAEMHDAILGRFLERQADIMVGTQLVAKGLDLPRVTLVGVVSADTGLHLPDFRACERTFQLLTQVAGRAGRGLLGGHVILQTYEPDNYAIRAASKHDYAGFYTEELEYRRQMGYPPFRRLARLLFQHPREIKARDEAQRAAAFLRGRIEALGLTATELIGPAPCFFTRLNDQYRWHLLIRSPDPTPLIDQIDPAQGWYVDIDPVDLL